ncbi:hypothetical protein [Wenzhouxiangella marina]|uniref:Uncharacterized protein n=1 Tax=Wenzhouxiangella marina TaxID=1579979 RepID=A0A0K0XVR0_9GAMM|nr:hypothetical protein [Wenzhouxiangella marina]AKS41794.1 hypothetical protein WM2015_1422 [Wenzhouxiangella marina]MBB6086444.1 hypothetical protein [Wenzhouxiangella marina]
MADSLTQRDAELIARQFNAAFTTVNGYGLEHPMSGRSVDSLLQTLKQSWALASPLTLLLDRGSLFVESQPVGDRFNPRRLITLLNQLGLQSISFDDKLDAAALSALLGLLRDPDRFSDTPALQAALEQTGVTSIRLNYVTFRKVTADEQVVSSGEIQPVAASSNKDDSPLARMLEIARLIEADGDRSAPAESSGQAKERERIVHGLRTLIEQIEKGHLDFGVESPDALLSAVDGLRRRLRNEQAEARDLDVLMEAEPGMLDEVDQLTYSTLVRLMREEYRGDHFSPRRMAQIISRMIPDARELKRLMPQLKLGLMAEGMSLKEYGRLIHELSGEFRADHLLRAMEHGADQLGMDLDEIVGQIREDPEEAARLIVIASELRRAGVDDQSQLSQAFTDYIERVSEQLSLSPSSAATGSDNATGRQLDRVQRELIEALDRHGLGEELSKRLRAQLNSQTTDPASGGTSLPSTQHVDPPPDAGPDPLSEPSATAVADRQDEPRAETPPSRRRAELPQRILSPANTAFFLTREIKSTKRYRTPFSVILFSVEAIRFEDGRLRRVEAGDLETLLPALYRQLIEQLRDLDLIGALDPEQATPLMILPMTDQAGADIVRWRLADRFRDLLLDIDDQRSNLIPTITAMAYDMSENDETRDFLRKLHAQHKRHRAQFVI